MGRSKETFGKREKEKKRLKKKQEKQRRKEDRRAAAAENPKGMDHMIAYVDEDGNFSETPPDPTKKKKIKADQIEIGIPRRQEESISIRKGRLDFFNDQKGFGFIKEQNSHNKYFTHISGFEDELMEGDMVTFELERGLKGMNAVHVRKA